MSSLTEAIFVGLIVQVLLLIVTENVESKKTRLAILIIGLIASGFIYFFYNGLISLDRTFLETSIVTEIATPNNGVQTDDVSENLTASFILIDISSQSENDSPRENLGLQPGENILANIPFENGWIATSECSHLPLQPETFVFDLAIQNVDNVYFLLQTGHGIPIYAGDVIGNIRLYFKEGYSISTELILGENMRDWNWSNPDAVTTTTSKFVQPAWKGTGSDGTSGGMDMLTVPVSTVFEENILERIEIVDLSRENSGGINPCIQLLALTVEYYN